MAPRRPNSARCHPTEGRTPTRPAGGTSSGTVQVTMRALVRVSRRPRPVQILARVGHLGHHCGHRELGASDVDTALVSYGDDHLVTRFVCSSVAHARPLPSEFEILAVRGSQCLPQCGHLLGVSATLLLRLWGERSNRGRGRAR